MTRRLRSAFLSRVPPYMFVKRISMACKVCEEILEWADQTPAQCQLTQRSVLTRDDCTGLDPLRARVIVGLVGIG